MASRRRLEPTFVIASLGPFSSRLVDQNAWHYIEIVAEALIEHIKHTMVAGRILTRFSIHLLISLGQKICARFVCMAGELWFKYCRVVVSVGLRFVPCYEKNK